VVDIVVCHDVPDPRSRFNEGEGVSQVTPVAQTSKGKFALRLVKGGLAFTVLCIMLNMGLDAAGLEASIGPLHVIAALALVGMLAVVAGGVFAMIAILKQGERSSWVLATVVLSVFALLVVITQVVFDVP
jgi:hypothetical protein